MWYHEEESDSIGVLLTYGIEHGKELLTFTYSDSEAYLCKFVSSYESDNIAQVEEFGAEYDEFVVILYDVVKILQPGAEYSEGDGGLEVSYRNLPQTVTNQAGEVIFTRHL